MILFGLVSLELTTNTLMVLNLVYDLRFPSSSYPLSLSFLHLPFSSSFSLTLSGVFGWVGLARSAFYILYGDVQAWSLIWGSCVVAIYDFY